MSHVKEDQDYLRSKGWIFAGRHMLFGACWWDPLEFGHERTSKPTEAACRIQRARDGVEVMDRDLGVI